MNEETFKQMISELGPWNCDPSDDDAWMDKWGEQLGDCLKWWIKKHHRKPTRVARRLKVDRATIYRWTDGEDRPSGEKRRRLLRLLKGLPPTHECLDEFLGYIPHYTHGEPALLSNARKELPFSIFSWGRKASSDAFVMAVNEVERLFEWKTDGKLSADDMDELEDIADLAFFAGHFMGRVKRAHVEDVHEFYVRRLREWLEDLKELRSTTSPALWLKGFPIFLIAGFVTAVCAPDEFALLKHELDLLSEMDRSDRPKNDETAQ